MCAVELLLVASLVAVCGLFVTRLDIDATELLVEHDAAQNSLDLFGNNATEPDEQYNTSLAQTALDKATDAISVLVRRVST